MTRNSSSILMMDVIKDEGLDDIGDGDDDPCFEAMSTPPSNAPESFSTDEENEISAV